MDFRALCRCNMRQAWLGGIAVLSNDMMAGL